MEETILILVLLLLLVLVSFALDQYSVMLLSHSGFALIIGLLVGLVLWATNSLDAHLNLDNDLFFDVLLPPIIYESGFAVKRRAFFRNFPAILSTSIIGTIVSACATGGMLYAAGYYGLVPNLSWVEMCLFGALLSAVDPVATLGVFSKLNAPPLLFNLVFGESVLNDAVAIALYQTLQKWQPDHEFTGKQVLLVAANTGGMFFCSLLAGGLITLAGGYLLKREFLSMLRHYPTYEISLVLIVSLLTYFVTVALDLSGIVAIFISGTMTAHYQYHTVSKEAQHTFRHLLRTAAFISETIVYVFMGVSIVMLFVGHNEENAGTALHGDQISWSLIFVALGACFVARFVNIFPLLGLSNCSRSQDQKIPLSHMTVIWVSGLRGSMAFALAKSWSYKDSHGNSHRKLIESTTLAVVMFTTLVVGGLTGPFLSMLGLAHKKDEEEVDTASETSTRSQKDVTMEGVQNQKETTEEENGNEDKESAKESSSDDEYDSNWEQRLRHPGYRDRWMDIAEHGCMASLLRSWEEFDRKHMQPLFGGHTQRGMSNPMRTNRHGLVSTTSHSEKQEMV